MGTLGTITPLYEEVKPKGFYVYKHICKTDGTVFYIGKGSGNRAWVASNRSEWWKRVVRENGCVVSIIRDGLSEHDALNMEVYEIQAHRKDGCRLVNMTDGGDGASGGKKRTVYTSLGEVFDSLKSACEYMKSIGFSKCASSSISTCINGRKKSIYGRAWSYDGKPPHPKLTGRNAQAAITSIKNGKTVYCSNGMSFKSLQDEAAWVRHEKGINATHRNISNCATGKSNSAYGFVWSYTNRYASRPSANFKLGPTK